MTTAAFQASLVAKLRAGLIGASAKLERFRRASSEALLLCRRHPKDIPDQAISGFERKYRDLWKTARKGDIVERT